MSEIVTIMPRKTKKERSYQECYFRFKTLEPSFHGYVGGSSRLNTLSVSLSLSSIKPKSSELKASIPPRFSDAA